MKLRGYVFGLFLLVGLNLPVFSEPYIAVRTGLKCAVCHINRSGGGKRTDYGVIYSQTKLSMKNIRPDGEKTGSYFSNRLGQNVTIGGNLRIDEVRTMEYTTSHPTGKTNTNDAVDVTTTTAEASRRAGITEGNVYIQAELVPNRLTFYMDQTISPSSAPRELFGMIEGLPMNSYVKMGQMLLPYGYRLLDDKAFVRGQTTYTYGRTTLAAEFGIEPGPFSWIVNATNDELSSVATLVYRRFRVGASYGVNREETKNFLYGAFAGVNFGRFTFLGEADIIKRDTVENRAYYFEGDVLLTQGLNFKGTYEVYDRDATNIPLANNGQERITVGLEYFVTQFFQLGAFYRINNYIPQNAEENQDNIILRAHFFF